MVLCLDFLLQIAALYVQMLSFVCVQVEKLLGNCYQLANCLLPTFTVGVSKQLIHHCYLGT